MNIIKTSNSIQTVMSLYGNTLSSFKFDSPLSAKVFGDSIFGSDV